MRQAGQQVMETGGLRGLEPAFQLTLRCLNMWVERVLGAVSNELALCIENTEFAPKFESPRISGKW